MIKGKTYDWLKFHALIVLPALGTLYFTLAQIWGLPAAQEVVGTIVAIDAFLGAFLQLSSNAYENSDERFDGTIGVTETEGKLNYVLNLHDDPVALKDKKEVIFKVGPSAGDSFAA